MELNKEKNTTGIHPITGHFFIVQRNNHEKQLQKKKRISIEGTNVNQFMICK